MTQREFDKLDKQEQLELLNEIEDIFNVELDIPEPIYDDEGNLKNKKEVDKALKKILPLALLLFAKMYAKTKRNSINIMKHTNKFINGLKKAKKHEKTMITPKEWDKIIEKTVNKREKDIKIKQVIRGNANRLNKRVQQTVKDGYKNGKNYKQVMKRLQREFGYSKGKAKTIAITERNFYKSSAQLEAIDNCSEFVVKTWHHHPSKRPRDSHGIADGMVADKNGYFDIGGYKTKAPQHFGVAGEDVNCHCTMTIEIK